jgi:hypothetical protein
MVRLRRDALLDERHTPPVDDRRPSIRRRDRDEMRPAVVIGNADDDRRQC